MLQCTGLVLVAAFVILNVLAYNHARAMTRFSRGGTRTDRPESLDYAREHSHHPRLILFGQSMGAVAILRAAHEHGIKPDAVIVEAVFDSMLNTTRNRFKAMRVPSFPNAELLVFWGGRQWGFNGFAHNPAEFAKSLDCPVLFMHGTHDPRATLAEARRVFDAVSAPKSFVSFDAVGHEAYISARPRLWKRAVYGVLKP